MLTRPCKTCPFLIGGKALRGLHPDRCIEIADALQSDRSFFCHSTTDDVKSTEEHCAGAMLILEKLEMPNQIMRIMGRFGVYDPAKLNGWAEVFDDFEEWQDAEACHEFQES